MKRLKPSFVRKDERGIFYELINGNFTWKSINYGRMKAGSIMGNHYHKKCNAIFFLINGNTLIKIRNVNKNKIQEFKLEKNEGVFFEPYETHSIKFISESDYILLKDKEFNSEEEDLYKEEV